jgi:hypothetical protein
MRLPGSLLAGLSAVLLVVSAVADDHISSEDHGAARIALVRYFDEDPLTDPAAIHAGDALDRLQWQADPAAFPGDRPGSLRAIYDSSRPAGWFGFRLPGEFLADDTFSAAAAFVIESDSFAADPNGFFQISWGLWNAEHTGLERTGSFADFAADTFQLIEFDYFPSVSPFFGGPFLSPGIFGSDVSGDAFSNFSSLFGLEVGLPFDVPLLAVIEHRPDLDVVVLSVHRIVDSGRVVPLNGAVGSAPLAFLALREYDLNTIGLTLWTDGFGGSTPAVVATLDFHALCVVAGLVGRPEELLSGDHDDEDDDEDDD